jgi:hypothetical protein
MTEYGIIPYDRKHCVFQQTFSRLLQPLRLFQFLASQFVTVFFLSLKVNRKPAYDWVIFQITAYKFRAHPDDEQYNANHQ